MRQLQCPVCQVRKEITHYDHDNPVLECGHKYTSFNEERDLVYCHLRDEVYDIMRENRVSYKEATYLFWREQ